jgi:predicted SAM-dependent methyltransferase
MKLHLGCGEIRLDGWVNIDARDTPAVDAVCDLTELSSVAPPQSCDAIYACHVLEHFGFGCAKPTAFDVCRHWVSRLRIEGELFISVPDLQKVGAAIAGSQSFLSDWEFMKCLYVGCEYPQNRHFSGFTRRLLAPMLTEAGLSEIQNFESFAPDTSRFVLHGCDVSLNMKGRRL